jgi:peroxiredoxin
MKIHFWLTITFLLSASAVARADNPARESVKAQPASYKIGDVVANFSLKNTDGNVVSLNDYSSKKGVIIIFTSNHCPFAKAYEDRIIALNNKFSPQAFPVVALNPSDPSVHQDDSLEKMKERSAGKGYNFPYLVDHAQRVSRLFGASRTPVAYVLLKSGAGFTLQYVGMIDDNPQDPAGASKFYVDQAVTNLLNGKPVVTTMTKPVGCVVKFND